MLPQLSVLLIDEVAEQGSVVIVRARTPAVGVACPRCDQPSEQVHAYHVRRLADLPAGGRGVVVELRVRRFGVPECRLCPARSGNRCPRLRSGGRDAPGS